MNDSSDSGRGLLRHALAALAYRAGKTFRNAPTGFAEFQAGAGTRTPGEILAHMGDLMDWAHSIAAGHQTWQDSKPLAWEKELERFFGALKGFDEFLASAEPLRAPAGKLLQGPIADALTHVGQLAIMRRLAGTPVKGENYFAADIVAGRVGAEQPAPKREF